MLRKGKRKESLPSHTRYYNSARYGLIFCKGQIVVKGNMPGILCWIGRQVIDNCQYSTC